MDIFKATQHQCGEFCACLGTAEGFMVTETSERSHQSEKPVSSSDMVKNVCGWRVSEIAGDHLNQLWYSCGECKRFRLLSRLIQTGNFLKARGCHDEKSAETALDTSVMPGGDEVLISACGGYSFLAKIVSFDDVMAKILGRREHSPEITKSPVQA
ncbi:hypothetical protein HGM15179_012454 [Zosterops borbonicus]|uniref:Uncharacterized protein n=1 Tax=Zosterops borbonicus TaxID=364589 RepID=A0A8K1LI34_9PASS|nr:hypothetical protein HGM15179_012454 [Zosterops borbonicus]